MRTSAVVPVLVVPALLCGLVLTAFAQAGTAPPKPLAPKLEFTSTAFDFGRVPAGDIVRASFTFTNTGSAPLDISEVRPTCGCTVAGTWDRQVAPGKTGTIPLQVNTANFSGQVVKMVTVVCNDPTQPTAMLQIKGTIWKPVEVTPTFVVFNVTGDVPTNEVRIVKIVNNTEAPLVLSDLQSANPVFRAEIKTNQPGKDFDLQVSLAPSLNTGTVQGVITMKTSSTNAPVIAITALAMVLPPVVAMPGQVFLQSGPLPGPTQVAVSIRNNASEPVTVSDASVSLNNVQAQIQESQPGRLFTVTLSFPKGLMMPPGQIAQLSLKTSHPRMPEIKVPIVQMAPPPPPVTAPAPPAAIAAPAPPPSIAAPAPPLPPAVHSSAYSLPPLPGGRPPAPTAQ